MIYVKEAKHKIIFLFNNWVCLIINITYSQKNPNRHKSNIISSGLLLIPILLYKEMILICL